MSGLSNILPKRFVFVENSLSSPASVLSEDFLAKRDENLAPGLQGWKEGAPPAQQEQPGTLSL